MNKVILCGRLTKDPDVRSATRAGEELKVVRFTLAVDRRFKKDTESRQRTLSVAYHSVKQRNLLRNTERKELNS